MARGSIVGDWTHRRRDAGGTRALGGDVARARPEVAWTWRAPAGDAVDQVRIGGDVVHAATMPGIDVDAPGWERATIHALHLGTGAEMAFRTLPDPVPVSAVFVELATAALHVVATRPGEPVFAYELGVGDLRPRVRRRLRGSGEWREEALDGWTLPPGALWLEPATRDVCSNGNALFGAEDGVPPPVEDAGGAGIALALWQRGPVLGVGPLARFDLHGAGQAHAVAAAGLVVGVAAAIAPGENGFATIQGLGVDPATGDVRWSTAPTPMALRGTLGDAARVVHRSAGDVLFQRLMDGEPCSDLVRLRADGAVEALPFGNGKRFVLDAAVENLVLCHHEMADGRVVLAAVDVDRESRLLGRRASVVWSVDLPDLGGAVTVYAAADHVIVRGARAIAAVRV